MCRCIPPEAPLPEIRREPGVFLIDSAGDPKLQAIYIQRKGDA